MATRGNDTGPLKKASLQYMNVNQRPLNPPLVGADAGNKDKRGFNHPEIARLLMPARYEPTPEYGLLLFTPDFANTYLGSLRV